jgi:signal transduction histidine kinase
MNLARSPSEHEVIQLVCHELRSTLSPLRVWARLLRRGDVTPEQTRLVGEVLERGMQVLARLASDLAGLETAADGDIPMASGPLDLRETVLAVTRGMMPAVEAKGVALVVDVPAEAVTVAGDQIRLCQVLSNLVDNAMKFTDPPGRIIVRVRRDAIQAQVSVEDTGAGIDPEFLPHVFERFAREVPGNRPGHGLGLHLVKRLVERHRGTIVATSQGPGCGSRFVVTLPASPAVAA